MEEHQRAEDGDAVGRGVGRGAAEASCIWRCHRETLVCWHKSKPKRGLSLKDVLKRTRGFYSIVTKNEILSFAGRSITLSKISKTSTRFVSYVDLDLSVYVCTPVGGA